MICDGMLVGFVARKGNLSVSPSSAGLWGYSVQRLSSVLYERLLKNSGKKISIEAVELGIGSSTFTRRATLFTDLVSYDMRKYDIIHAPTPLPMRPFRIRKDAKVVTTSHGMHSIDRKGQCHRVE